MKTIRTLLLAAPLLALQGCISFETYITSIL